MRGVLEFYSETGTEGGDWAFQDGAYISTRVEQRCRKCGSWWNTDNPESEPDGDKEIGDTGFVIRSCKKGEHDVGPVEVPAWSYEGLHILEDGDELMIFDKEDKHIVWTGKIELVEHDLFTEHAYGMWIHADQKNVERDVWAKWFMESNPAELKKRA